MTAINILVQRDAVHFVSDGASYDAEQRLVSVGPKVWPLPHISAAIGVRGPAIALPLLAYFVGHAANSYDALKINIVEVLENAFANIHIVLGQCATGAAFEVAIGGISETIGADAYVVSCSKDGMVSPLTQITELGFMPSCEEIDSFVMMQTAKHLQSKSPIDEIDPSDFGLQTIEMQRSAKFGDHNTCHVGGFVQLTTVRASGVETKVLRRWPDGIGDLLNDNLTATSGAIGALSVDSLSISDNAVTVPSVQNFSGVTLTNGGGTVTCASFNLSVDTTGLSGKTITVYAIATFMEDVVIPSGGSGSASFSLFINGSSVANSAGGTYQAQGTALTGSASITGTGSVMTIAVAAKAAISGVSSLHVNGTLFAMAAKR